jgi:pyruvate dehydrogenase E2 component (dihydrolipoamide acetyltransferase)
MSTLLTPGRDEIGDEMAIEVKLPEMGEGIAAGDVVRVLVKPGDSVSEGQGLIELETDKALIEVPSDAAGVVDQVNVKKGDKLKVGSVIVSLKGSSTMSEAGSNGRPAPEKTESAKPKAAEGKPAKADEAKGKSDASAEQEAAQTWDEAVPPADNGARNGLPKPSGKIVRSTTKSAEPKAASRADSPVTSKEPARANVPAGPASRRLAREFGIDLRQVRGSGPGGRIYQSDVVEFAKRSGGTGAGVEQRQLPDFSRWGEIHREHIGGVRRKIAEQMAYCAAVVAQVTQFERADVTTLEQMRKRREDSFEKQGGKLTLTVLLIRALTTALKTYPRFNCSLDLATEELVYKDYIHLGIAVDTDRGLLVPVLRDADKKDLLTIASELPEIAERARSGKIDLADLTGASFTISNQGSIGGAEFTPIVNWPEVAILGVGRSRLEPGINANSGAIEPRLYCPLALSYDHRAVDGADAARFISLLKELLEDPERLLLGV